MPAAADGPNLLANPGFESPYAKQCCHTSPAFPPGTPIDEVQVAAGWSGWWLEPDQDPYHPGSCENKPGCNVAWHRPEWREAACGSPCADRVRSGGNAQKYFTFFSVHDAGMYQRAGGVAPGQRVRFSIYMQGWTTHSNYGNSDFSQSMGMRVGIDPFGESENAAPDSEMGFYLRNASILVLPFLIGFLTWRRDLDAKARAGQDVSTELLFKCIQCVHASQYWLGHQTVSDLVDAIVLKPADHRPSKATLTSRELDIVAAIVDGASNREIAQQFGLSPQTVKNHLSSIFDKLGVSNRLELALYAVNHRVLSDRTGLR